MATLFSLFTLAALASAAYATRCLECVDMPHPEDCSKVTTCTAYEDCYVEQFVTSGGLILYNSGCLAKERCKAQGKRDVSFTSKYLAEKRRSRSIHAVHKRQEEVSATDIATCVECCEGSFCNTGGCGELAVPRENRGPICFDCQDQEDPLSCRTLKSCYQGQVCVIRKLNIYNNLWTTDCVGERQCHAIVQVEEAQEARLGLIGRRRETVERTHCPRCCEDDFCNDSCLQNFTITTEPTTTIAAPTRPTTHETTTPKPTTTRATTTRATTTTTTTKPTTTIRTTPRVITTRAATKPTTTKATTTRTKPTTTTTTRQTTTTPKPTTTTTRRTTTTPKPTTTTTRRTTTTPKPTTTTTKPTTTTTTTPKPTTTTTTPTTTTTTRPTTTTMNPKEACESDSYQYFAQDNLCLLFYTTPQTNWTNARDFCQSHDGILVVKGTGEDKINAVMAIYEEKEITDPLWVGATSIGASTIYIWGDGTRETVDPTEGKDLSKADCVYLTAEDYRSVDPCGVNHGFICERLQSAKNK